jgi:hypothetical protein
MRENTLWCCRGRLNPLKVQLNIHYGVREIGVGIPLLDLRKIWCWTVPEQERHPSKWPSPKQSSAEQINTSKRFIETLAPMHPPDPKVRAETEWFGFAPSNEGACTNSSAKSPSSESLIQTPVRVSEETHHILSVGFQLERNKDANFGLTISDAKKGTHRA